MIHIYYEKEPLAFHPVQGTSRSAGLDLCAANIPKRLFSVGPAKVILPFEVVKFDTGIRWLPDDPRVHALILPRSGIAVKKQLVPVNSPGLIDNDYRGNIIVALQNRGLVPRIVNEGDKIAQLVPFFQEEVNLQYVAEGFSGMVEAADEYYGNTRGQGGFGSTGARIYPEPQMDLEQCNKEV